MKTVKFRRFKEILARYLNSIKMINILSLIKAGRKWRGKSANISDSIVDEWSSKSNSFTVNTST